MRIWSATGGKEVLARETWGPGEGGRLDSGDAGCLLPACLSQHVASALLADA